ncbi:C40 family peptidase [Aureispira anguillae]|uniref:C40 family peptidase n=1 Tax=Aureispira anguillae TaxID=2864201 RepID=A0A915VK75_9BACT|nr:C40 family peptidase [Aureispira anguillae]BDS09529.1 C40 family peptidase [Aureispira anguillae]
MAFSPEFEKELRKIRLRVTQFMKIHANPHDTSRHNKTAEKLKKLDQIILAAKKAMGEMSNQEVVEEKATQLVIGTEQTALSAIIQGGESGGKGYNAYNRGTQNGRIIGADVDISLVDMTIGEIQTAQNLPLGDPNRLFAVGKYQMIPTTLTEAVRALGLSDTIKYSPETQELLFSDYLLGKKRPAIRAYIQGDPDTTAYAAQLAGAQEWASIACPEGHAKAGSSYYGSGNHASISAADFLSALDEARAAYTQNIEAGMSSDDAYRKAVANLQGNATATTTPTSANQEGTATTDDSSQRTATEEEENAPKNELGLTEKQVTDKLTDFFEAFDQITITVDNQPVGVQVPYFINKRNTKHNGWDGATETAGKGTPEELRAWLQKEVDDGKVRKTDAKGLRKHMEKNKRGVDCSGFVSQALNHLADKDGDMDYEEDDIFKPDNTGSGSLKAGASGFKAIEPSEVKAGDTLFFNNRGGINHIQIVAKSWEEDGIYYYSIFESAGSTGPRQMEWKYEKGDLYEKKEDKDRWQKKKNRSFARWEKLEPQAEPVLDEPA